MNKKSGYIIDKVTEDSFYENLLLGLPKLLDTFPYVSYKKLKRAKPVSKLEIRDWENLNGVMLPDDLRAFYASTNGFEYTYIFSCIPLSRDDDENKLMGKVDVNPIYALCQMTDYSIAEVAKIENTLEGSLLQLSSASRVFELSTTDDYAKVILVYLHIVSVPTIWLLWKSEFYFLAEDFESYLRMAITHLGIPGWQLIFTRDGISGRSKEMFQIMAPGVLVEDQNLVTVENDVKVNRIDPNVFTVVPAPVSPISPPSTNSSPRPETALQSLLKNSIPASMEKNNRKKVTSKFHHRKCIPHSKFR